MKKLAISLLLVMVFSATSFAGVAENVKVKTAGGGLMMESAETTYDAEGNPIEMSYIDPYYQQGVSVNVEVREKYVPTGRITASGYYYVYGAKSSEEARKQLDKKFTEAKSSLGVYGKVRKGYVSVYEDGYYEGGGKGSYTGSVDIDVEMKSGKNFGLVREKMEGIGLTGVYANSTLDAEEAIELEARSATKLRNLINKKKNVYETILGYSLGKIVSLSTSTWMDTYNFDEETGEFEAVISAYAVLEQSK